MKLFVVTAFVTFVLYSSASPAKEALLHQLKMENNVDPTEAETAYSPNSNEGDIVLNPGQLRDYKDMSRQYDGREKRKAVNTDNYKVWPSGIIPYEWDTIAEGNRPNAQKAMRAWEENTCLTFPEWPAEGVNHNGKLSFVDGTGCWSNMAFTGGTQKVSLDSSGGCSALGVALHEIGHVIGLWHEHTRPDRNDTVTIKGENIEPGKESSFTTKDWAMVDSHDVPYDVTSIMHYAPKAFSVNGLPTIEAEAEEFQSIMGKQTSLSHLDHKIVNLMYKCNGCGGKLTGTSGSFSTPNYPSNYVDVTADDLQVVTTDDLQDVTTDDLQDVTTDHLQGVTTDDLQDITTDDLQGVKTDDLQDITTDDLQDTNITTEDLQDVMTDDLQDVTTDDLQDVTTDDLQDVTTDDL
uniref:Metalloendopeptidase n=1 Tax=Saccoglossus kowalevskii TaxID=10224 RepID=A0ABM0GK25_SACKO|nr:PREDICTED: blastula protease 10-like [Saccoglossus kowalevskii]